MDISIGGTGLLLAILGIALLVVAVIVGMKRMYAKRSQEGPAKQKGRYGQSLLDDRTKYPWANVFRHSGTFLRLGLLLAVGITILAFSWTQYEKEIFVPDDALAFDDEIEMEPPRTAEPPPPPPPPPPPVIEEVPDEEILEEDEPEFVDMSVEEESYVQTPDPVKEAPPPPPPPPPPPAPKEEEIFRVVEDMPRFPGCENLSTKQEKQQCADKKMLEFIYSNIKYPAIARENGVEGTAVIQFVVEKDGSVTDAKIVRNPGAQTGEEALRVVNLMNEKGFKWVPGKQRGRPVRVQFNLPVKFRLE